FRRLPPGARTPASPLHARYRSSGAGESYSKRTTHRCTRASACQDPDSSRPPLMVGRGRFGITRALQLESAAREGLPRRYAATPGAATAVANRQLDRARQRLRGPHRISALDAVIIAHSDL